MLSLFISQIVPGENFESLSLIWASNTFTSTSFMIVFAVGHGYKPLIWLYTSLAVLLYVILSSSLFIFHAYVESSSFCLILLLVPSIIDGNVLSNSSLENEQVLENIREQFNNPVVTLNGQIEQLKAYEIPTYIEFVSELPRKEGTDKVDYKYLEQDAVSKLKNNKEKQKVLKSNKG